MNIAFTTERLHIRFAQIADAAELLKLVNQANFTKYIGDKGIYTLDDAKKYIKDSFISAHKQHGFGPYIIALQDETLVGIVGFYQRAVLQYPDLGFALKDGFEKKGYIFEAANTLLNHRQNLGINQVTAIARCDNRASKNVLQKLGFKTQGQVIIESTNIAVDVYLLNTERN